MKNKGVKPVSTRVCSHIRYQHLQPVISSFRQRPQGTKPLHSVAPCQARGNEDSRQCEQPLAIADWQPPPARISCLPGSVLCASKDVLRP